MKTAPLITIASALIIAACKGDGTTSATAAGTLAIVSGDSQSVVVGGMVSAPLVARLTSSSGSPLVGSKVVWSVPGGVGVLSDSNAVTDGDGKVSTTYATTDLTGAVAVNATFESAGVAFTVLQTAGKATQFIAGTGNGVAVLIGNGVALTAKVLDSLGNGVPGFTVTWTTNGGILRNVTTTTDASGTSSSFITVGPAAGRVTVQAACPGFTTLIYLVDGVSPTAAASDVSRPRDGQARPPAASTPP